MAEESNTKSDPSAVPAAPGDPYAPAKATLRDTLKWLATTFAAVAGVVMAGTSLTGIGKLAAANQKIALLEGGGGLLCIVIATGVMVYLLLPRVFYFGELLEPKNRQLLARLNRHAIELLPPEFESIDEFVNERDTSVKLIRTHQTDPESAGYRKGAAFLDEYYDDIVKLSYFAHYELMRTSVHRAQWFLLLLGALAITGLGLFAAQIGSASDSKDPASAKSPTPLIANVSVDIPALHLGPQAPVRTETQSISVLLSATVDANGTDTQVHAPTPGESKTSALPPLLALIDSLAAAGAIGKETAASLRDELVKNSLEGGKEILVHVAKKVIDEFFPDDRTDAALVTVNGCGCGCGSPSVKHRTPPGSSSQRCPSVAAKGPTE
jgi:hypothetical protein